MYSWTFLTTHGRTLLFIARHPDARLRDIAANLGVTERTVTAAVRDLADAGT
jgi:DNA-binding MarR family transcriptional regulator